MFKNNVLYMDQMLLGGRKVDEVLTMTSNRSRSRFDDLDYPVKDYFSKNVINDKLYKAMSYWPYNAHYLLHYVVKNIEFIRYYRNAEDLQLWMKSQQELYQRNGTEAIIIGLYMWDKYPQLIEDMEPHFRVIK